MIECGWCGKPTTDRVRCASCRHLDPEAPWRHRGESAPLIESPSGRPILDEHAIRRRYAEAKGALVTSGTEPTIEALAEALDRSPRTVREWRKRYGLR